MLTRERSKRGGRVSLLALEADASSSCWGLDDDEEGGGRQARAVMGATCAVVRFFNAYAYKLKG